MTALSGGKGNPKFLLYIFFLVVVFLIFTKMTFVEGNFHSFVIIIGLVIFALTLVKTEWALVVLVFATLLSPELEIGKVGSREVTIRIEDVLLVVLVITWLAKVAINKEIGLLKKTPLNNAIKIFSVIALVATVLGILRGNVFAPKGIFFVLKYIEYFVLFFLVVNNVYQESQVRLLLISFFVVCFVICVYAFTQIGVQDRLSAPFERSSEPNTFGGYLLFLFAVCCGLFLYSEQWRDRIIFGGLATFALSMLFFTLSRGSYFGLIGSYLVFLILGTQNRKILIFGAVLAVLLIALIPGAVQERILYTFSIWHPEISSKTVEIGKIKLDPSSSARIESWQYAIKDFYNRPIIGYGVSGRGLIDCQYFTVFVEMGLLGLISFLFLLWRIWRMGYTAYRQQGNPFYKGLFLGYLAGFIGLLFHAVTANTFILIRVMEPFWFLTGIIVLILDKQIILPKENEKIA